MSDPEEPSEQNLPAISQPQTTADFSSNPWDGWTTATVDIEEATASVVLDGEEAQGVEILAAPAPNRMSQEAFRIAFCAGWSMPGQIDADFKPLAITKENQFGADKTSDVIYGLLERFAPGVLNELDARYMDYVIAGGFLFGQYKITIAILDLKRAAMIQQPEQPANHYDPEGDTVDFGPQKMPDTEIYQ